MKEESAPNGPMKHLNWHHNANSSVSACHIWYCVMPTLYCTTSISSSVLLRGKYCWIRFHDTSQSPSQTSFLRIIALVLYIFFITLFESCAVRYFAVNRCFSHVLYLTTVYEIKRTNVLSAHCMSYNDFLWPSFYCLCPSLLSKSPESGDVRPRWSHTLLIERGDIKEWHHCIGD